MTSAAPGAPSALPVPSSEPCLPLRLSMRDAELTAFVTLGTLRALLQEPGGEPAPPGYGELVRQAVGLARKCLASAGEEWIWEEAGPSIESAPQAPGEASEAIDDAMEALIEAPGKEARTLPGDGAWPLEADEVRMMRLAYEASARTLAEGPSHELTGRDIRVYMRMSELAALALLSRDPHDEDALAALRSTKALLALKDGRLAQALRDRSRRASGI